MCIKAKHSHIIVIITSGAIVPHMDSTQTAQKGWLKLLIAAPPDISDDSLLLPISLLFSGWSHWWGEAAMPRGKLYPLAAASLSAHRGPGHGSGSCWYHSQYDWRLVGPIGWEPCSPPGYHIAVSSCWLLFSATWEGHRLVAVWSPWAPFTLTLSLSVSWSLALSLRGLLTHTVVCSHRTRYCRYAARSERRDDLSFSTACISRRTVLSWLRGAPRPLRSPPRVREPWFNSVDLNKIYLHPTTSLVNTRKQAVQFLIAQMYFDGNPHPEVVTHQSQDESGLRKAELAAHRCDSATLLPPSLISRGCVDTTALECELCFNSSSPNVAGKLHSPFSCCFISLPRPTNGCREIQKNTNKTLPRH